MSGQDFDQQRRAMVSNQLRTSKVTDAAVLAAMGAVPRERFVGADQAGVAYRDTMVPLGGGRALNTPIAIGRMLNAARPVAGEKVLVVGSGTGYVAALLADMGCKVTALESDAALAARAVQAGVATVEGALAEGWAAGAPYDLIVIDGAIEQLPESIVAQIAPQGRLVGAVMDHGVTRLIAGRRVGASFGFEPFAEVEVAPLPGFAPAPAFIF